MEREKITNPVDNTAETLQGLQAFMQVLAPAELDRGESIADAFARNFAHGPERSTFEFARQDPGDDNTWHRATCTLYLGVKFDYTSLEAEDGSIWRKGKISVEVNWAAYGSTAPALAVHRLDLMLSVAKLAKHIEEEFGDKEVLHCVYTVKDVAEMKRIAEASKNQSAAENLVREATKGMRAGLANARFVPCETVAAGTYVATFQKRTYHVVSKGDGMVRIERVEAAPKAVAS